jgi:pyruvate,water dikinase
MEEASSMSQRFIRQFTEIGIDDVPEVGGKNASLGEMIRELSGVGIRVPDGFATTADAFRYFLTASGLDDKIARMLSGLNTQNVNDLRVRGRQIREAVLSASLPTQLAEEIASAYQRLSGNAEEPIDVAVRTSATAEDLPEASFAGQHETYLNVRGTSAVQDAVKRSFASLFTDRAISYRVDKGFDHMQVALSAGVQRMVRSDLSASGVMFSLDTETGFRDVVLINAAYGLGENIVQGTVNPDEFYIFKPTLAVGCRPIVKRSLGSKEFKMVYEVGGSKLTKNIPVPAPDRGRFCIDDDEVLTLARWACIIEEHYSRRRGEACPMDMEWAKDGISGELFVLQARPETVHSQQRVNELVTYHLKQRSEVLASGRSVGEKIGDGPVRVLKDAHHLSEFRPGEVLVTDKTDPDWEPIMKKAAAIVTNRGGRTCHAAIVSRELGLPAILGTEHGTEVLRPGELVTVSCAEGDIGYVYRGKLDYEVERINLESLPHPRVKIMMNVGNPDEVFSLSNLPNDGVGLARMEFIVTTYIKIHPMALLQYDQCPDPHVKSQIDELTRGFQDKPKFFVDRLAEGVGTIAAAFYPKDVIVRMSDFKTNEYANLIGGQPYEPVEENPMIGFRGASRYYDPRYREAFGLECRAMTKVRDVFGLTNLKLMIPFCRTVEEGRRVQVEMEKHGLRRGERGLEIYVMCEIPSNVACAAEFCEIFDGFSIGSNDLTQLMLGVDRDSEIVAHLFDERDPAVTRVISQVIQTAKRFGRKIGICGQAPSDYPEFAEFLVREGIDSISLNPDAVIKTTLQIAELEKKRTAT